MLPLSIFAQDRIVTGTVVNATDKPPLPGVNVPVKGTTNGTVTDAEGRYQISVAENSTLVFSMVGQKSTERQVGSLLHIYARLACRHVDSESC
ncbi:MAG: carboxypeptidase-like regulatory domain-containing protein [Cyclobacteriaceae bacterium]